MKVVFKVAGFIIISGLIVIVAVMYSNQKKVAYVELGEVYNDFQLKKELEAKLEKVQQTRQSMLDSIAMDLESMARKLDMQKMNDEEAIEKFEAVKQDYLMKQRIFSEDNSSATDQYTEQIWKQLNQYVKDFGQTHGYDYILGADGSGAVMFAAEGENITKEVKQYINERYKGTISK